MNLIPSSLGRSAHRQFALLAATAAITVGCAHVSRPTTQGAPATMASVPMDPTIARIRDEGLNHSKAPETLDYLCNVIGQRLTGSPGQHAASEWTRSTLAEWGLKNAHLETWGPFGRGWTYQHYLLQVVQPYSIQLISDPLAWSPGLEQPLQGVDVIYLDAHRIAELDKYKGKLQGKVVLIGTPRHPEADFDPLSNRMDADRLGKLASATLGKTSTELLRSTAAPTTNTALTASLAGPATTGPTTQHLPNMDSSQLANVAAFTARAIAFAQNEGASLVIQTSTIGDGGTFVGASVTVPSTEPINPPRRRRHQGSTAPATSAEATEPAPAATIGSAAAAPAALSPSVVAAPTTRPRAWSPDVPPMPPQAVVSIEDFNRLVSMLRHGVDVKIDADLHVTFDDNPTVSNTVAEIPGTDLKDQVVMVGGHLDSWHTGTGATDNAAGAVASMEAIRILQALDLHPRRTIRVALWTGEEEGLLGSTAYVKEHVGEWVPAPTIRPTPTVQPATGPTPNAQVLVKGPEWDKVSVYFNLDNGSGKIRGIYAQSNPDAVPLFKQWIAPFADLGASTVTVANTGSTDHIAFDRVGVPGFQFIQDPLEYRTRTHHTNEDVFDRLQMDDVRQAATIMAAFLWDAANTDQEFPRKAPTPPTPTSAPATPAR